MAKKACSPLAGAGLECEVIEVTRDSRKKHLRDREGVYFEEGGAGKGGMAGEMGLETVRVVM